MSALAPGEPLPVASHGALVRLVPPGARRILAVGPDDGLARKLRQALSGASVLHADDSSTTPAAGGFDALACAAVEALADPVAALATHRLLLRPGAPALVLAANPAHHARLGALLCGNGPSHPPPLSCAAVQQLLLAAGYAPDLADAVLDPCPPELRAAFAPWCARLGLHPTRAAFFLDAATFVFRAVPEPEPPAEASAPLTFVACVSDEAALQANLLRSPCLAPGGPHQLLLRRGCASAAEGLHAALAEARHPVVVCLHQDVYLPAGWDRRFAQQYRRAERLFGPVGVAGVYGAAGRGKVLARAGRVVDRFRLLSEPAPLPAAVDTLDEMLLVIPRDTPLRLDPALGFHLYGADLCLQATAQGLAVVALDALCLHNSQTVELPPTFTASAAVLARKWPDRLPVATSCGWVGPAAQQGPVSAQREES